MGTAVASVVLVGTIRHLSGSQGAFPVVGELIVASMRQVPYNQAAASGYRASKDSSMQGILRLVIVLAFIAIVVSLGTALYHLARGNGGDDSSRKMVRSLTVRIVLSLLLFLLIMAAWWAGLIAPHGLQPR
ncbi:MAG TPA: twin transmembrane helix small protein [Steroidobacteraceae bacterium]